MKHISFLFITSFFITVFCFPPSLGFTKNTPLQPVIEESYYEVKPENESMFLELHKTRVLPFWKEIKKRGLIEEDMKIYTQRLHTLEPRWTFKTVVKFKNYTAIDKWLEIREELFRELFPGEEYKELRNKIMRITERHWDVFLREIPLE
ncbi:MAG: hypothetical protein KatS3mg078_0669 [Deltaproteobacteria bacterium]|jgi:hypothetical protein|nr:MAG: hypothetical protein KatS3mg078_0669 [Deltaproteobacteria bacterium]